MGVDHGATVQEGMQQPAISDHGRWPPLFIDSVRMPLWADLIAHLDYGVSRTLRVDAPGYSYIRKSLHDILPIMRVVGGQPDGPAGGTRGATCHGPPVAEITAGAAAPRAYP